MAYASQIAERLGLVQWTVSLTHSGGHGWRWCWRREREGKYQSLVEGNRESASKIRFSPFLMGLN
jgi:hypothetical protein